MKVYRRCTVKGRIETKYSQGKDRGDIQSREVYRRYTVKGRIEQIYSQGKDRGDIQSREG